ncbi:MAG TPA: hypothetical protein VKY19_08080 [Ktedonosporobacter sp.]|jgi:hypothetical protein|nr:hypothetical protein [Ktedonosporobacter sp.]
MIMGNFIFPELRFWALATAWCAAILIFGVIGCLIMSNVRHSVKGWQTVALLLILAVGGWSLMVAFNGYQQWLDIVHHAPAHGLGFYARIINQSYIVDVQRCQIQFAFTALPLLWIGWHLLNLFKQRAVPSLGL